MFGKKRQQAGPYRVDVSAGKASLEKLLNQRYAEGYDCFAILQNQAFGSNSTRDVVFKLRTHVEEER